MRGDERKHDGGKLMWDLLPWGPLRQIVAVFTKGAERYGEESWKDVPGWRRRYFAAMMRHLEAWYWKREWSDPDDGLPHLAHAGWYCLTLMWLCVRHGEATEPGMLEGDTDAGER